MTGIHDFAVIPDIVVGMPDDAPHLFILIGVLLRQRPPLGLFELGQRFVKHASETSPAHAKSGSVQATFCSQIGIRA